MIFNYDEIAGWTGREGWCAIQQVGRALPDDTKLQVDHQHQPSPRAKIDKFHEILIIVTLVTTLIID